MRKNFILILFILAVFVFINVSCGSAPAPAETPEPVSSEQSPTSSSAAAPSTPPSAVPAPATVSADPAAIARANSAKQRAVEFEIDQYAGSEWDSIVARHNAARTTADYNAAADSYDELFGRYIWMYAQANEIEITEEWQQVKNSSLAAFISEDIRDAENTAVEALDLYEAGNYNEARVKAELAKTQFDSLLYAAEVFDVRIELEEFIIYSNSTNLALDAQPFLESADNISFAAVSQYDAGNYTEARATAETARDNYETLMAGANTYLSEEKLMNMISYTDLMYEIEAIQYLDAADRLSNEALSQYVNGNYAEARETAESAKEEYDLLYLAANVWLTRQDILIDRFNTYDPVNFARAEEVALSALVDFRNGNREDAVMKAEEALLRYDMVIDIAMPSYAAEKRRDAEDARFTALIERADVAARSTFDEAALILLRADSLMASGQFLAASREFTSAEGIYTQAREEATERRRRAEETIRRADEIIGRSGGTAIEAERIIEGGSR